MFPFKRNQRPAKLITVGQTGAFPWHAVRVVPGPCACTAVKQFGNKRWLGKEAPRLPLAACTTPSRCKCTYRHFEDRRAGPRRAGERSGLSRPLTGSEKRRLVGRRATDQPSS